MLRSQSLLSRLILLLSSLETLHLLFEDFVDVGDGTTFVLELSGEGRQLIRQNGDLALGDFDFFIAALKRLSNLDKLALFGLDLTLSLLVGFLLALKASEVLLVLVLFALQPAFAVTVLDTSLVDELIAATTVFNRVLPLQVELVSLLMQPFEFLSGFIKFDLSGLRLSHLLFELLGLAGDLDRQLLDL